MNAALETKVTTPLPVDLDAKLERIAKATGLKKSLLIRAALERQLPDIEQNGITFPPTDKADASAAAVKGVVL